MAKNNRDYPVSVAPLFKSGEFGYQTITINDEVLTKLEGVGHGGKFLIRFLKEESRKTEKSPVAYLEYLTPAQVEERKQYAKRNSERRNSEESI